MLRSCEYDGRLLEFSAGVEHQGGSNRFTVIVGKNGTGKSRLLRAIVESFVSAKDMEKRERWMFRERGVRTEMRVSSESIPSCIIALSTSPFDRFPILRGIEEFEYYQYLGLRGLGSMNLSFSFISRTLGALLRAVVFDQTQATNIQAALEYLGYEGFIEARFFSVILRNNLNEAFESANPLKMLLNELPVGRSHRYDRILHNIKQLNESEYPAVQEALRHWHLTGQKPRLDIRIDKTGAHDISTGVKLDEFLIPLFKIGFLELRDVGLQKKNSNSLIRINDASSGEQCVLMSLLGIASHIQDGAMICIDEPENCLHPEWQERYIQLLMTTFEKFKNCHFIIATHSPQVIAKLQDRNCFVLDIESGITTAASELNGRSADYQLARVFKTPGFKNEYLSRVLFNALRLIGGGKTLSKEQMEEVVNLLLLKKMLSEDDPVLQLMDIIEKYLKEVARA